MFAKLTGLAHVGIPLFSPDDKGDDKSALTRSKPA